MLTENMGATTTLTSSGRNNSPKGNSITTANSGKSGQTIAGTAAASDQADSYIRDIRHIVVPVRATRARAPGGSFI